MKPTAIGLLAGVVAILASSGAFAAAPEAAEAYRVAQQKCEAARQQKLAPIRERKVAQCVRSGKSRQHCATFYSTYGDNSNNANGSVVRGRFYDLPACRDAARAGRRLDGPQNF